MDPDVRKGLVKVAGAAEVRGLFGIAGAAHAAVGDVAKAIEYGDRAMRAKFVGLALEAYTAAGDATKVLTCGDKALELGYYDVARNAYAYLGIPIPREKLLQCGDAAVKRGWLQKALDAYLAASMGLDGDDPYRIETVPGFGELVMEELGLK